jgi:hypothetical protein
MLRSHRERGLSEIVGFILILAAIVIAVALYATFGIPAQGREGEIAHMNEVRDRFVEFKIGLDSLWSNRQCGTAIATSFTLGTGGGATTGSFSIIPILSPVKTSATLALNQRPEYIFISQDSYFMVDTGGYNESGFITAVAPSTNTLTFNNTPRYFLINVTSPNLLQRHGVHVYPTSGSAWEAWVNLTPNYFYSVRYSLTTNSSGYVTSFTNWTEYQWNRTDVTVSTWKGGVPLIQDLIVTTNVTSTGKYTVDLMNPGYGISSDLGSTQSPQTISLARSDSNIGASYLTNYSYWPTKVDQNWIMGSLEYKAPNEYWIEQTYYYQMGGVFLEQGDGTTVKVPPAITFSLSNGVPVVNINQIILSGSGVIEGSGPVQVKSALSSITDTRMATGNNTRYVNLSIQTLSNNTAQMWNRALLDAAGKAGFPASYYTRNTSGTVTYMNITPDPSIYGVRLSLNRVTVETALQSAAPSAGG